MRRTSEDLELAVIVVAFVCLNGAGSATRAEDKEPAKAAAAESDDQPVPLAPGDVAPEWDVTGWSDGKSRKLADVRGKVVFLDFWGVWCGPCRRSIPALKQLEKKYAEQGVVFLAIHSAGSKIEEMNKALEEESWSVPSGLDKGEGIMQGATVQSYGVRGFPTVVVINREGKISYNSSQSLVPENQAAGWAKMERMARDIGLPWPIDKDIENRDQLQSRLDKLALHMYSLEIERALKGILKIGQD
jgi:thiol-disulfide isomerase/thioredoxin